jgi:hypothetical protein
MLLLRKDKEQEKELAEGGKEVDELLKEGKGWKKESDA